MGGMGRFQASHFVYPLLALGSTIIFLIAGMLLAQREYFLVFIAEICVFYLIFGYGKTLVGAVFVFIPVSLFFLLLSCLINQNLHIAVPMALRVLLVGICVVPSMGMPQIRLIRNMNQIHCPRMLTLGMLIAVRFVPVVGSEVRQIREAMKTRGVRASLWNIKCFYRALLIPLVMRLINISDTLSMSLETRGFDMEKGEVSIYEPLRFTVRDGIYLAIMAGIIVANAILLP